MPLASGKQKLVRNNRNMRKQSGHFEPHPFLRWAGGKRRIVNQLLDIFPESFNPKVHKFHEPFVGGGALSLATGDRACKFYIPGKNLCINDINPELALTYKVIRDDVETLIEELDEICAYKSKLQFERVKNWLPSEEYSRAARFIYLNKTCFNGLWRVNNHGQFNVPWGKLKNPSIYSPKNLRSISERLRGSRITSLSFIEALKICKPNDLVYLDPPYIPLTKSSSFSKYTLEDFTILDHYALSGIIRALSDRKVKVILSNSDTTVTRKIFGEHMNLYTLKVNRSISASGNSRNQVDEIIATNFKIIEFNQIGMITIN